MCGAESGKVGGGITGQDHKGTFWVDENGLYDYIGVPVYIQSHPPAHIK